MTAIKGAGLGLVGGVALSVLVTMLIFVFGITRTGTTAVPGVIEVVNNDTGFTMQTSGGVLVPALFGVMLGAIIGHRRAGTRHSA
jgi:hypothetical protein